MHGLFPLLLLCLQAVGIKSHEPCRCLTQHQANLTATRLRSVLALQPSDLGPLEQTLEKLLANNFSSSSDSYSMLGGKLWQVGKHNTTNKQQELALGKTATRKQIVETLELAVVNCNKIFWFWNMTRFGDESLKYPVSERVYDTS